MHFFNISIFLVLLVVCWVKANEHSHNSTLSSLTPEESEREKREDGPPHPTPRQRRQVPPHEPAAHPHTPTPSRRKRHSEPTSTTMVHPVLEQADEIAEDFNESESAGVKKRETEENGNASSDVEEEDDATATTIENTVEEEKEEEEQAAAVSEDSSSGPSRAKRVSHAGSSHKNRPSAVNRLQTNSNVGNAEEEEGEDKEPEHVDVQHHDYEIDHMHAY